VLRPGIVTDEISSDLARALHVARELGIAEVELNSLWGRSIVELPAKELDSVERLIAAAGARICAVSTPAFKSVLLDDVATLPAAHPEVMRHLEWVARGCELAQRFRAPLVRIFAFRKSGMQGLGNPSPRLPRGGPIPDAVLEKIAAGLRPAGDLAEAAGVTLVVENVRSCWGNSCWNTARILRAADHPRLKMVWDPGNDYVAGGDPFPEGYEAARPWMAHVHVKNAAVENPRSGLTRWERVGGGDLDYRPMLRRLQEDAYEGVVVLETHWRGEGMSGEQSTRESFRDLQEILRGLS
jgi:sugar phosphate isomerase/epimerase